VPTALNVAQLIGWTAVELWAMSFVADLIAEEIFGFSARGVWLAVAAVVCTGLALWGPVGVTRVWMERFGLWVIGGISLVLTGLLIGRGLEIGSSLFTSSGAGGFPTFGPALDLVIAMPVSWLPLVADYTRFAHEPRAARKGTFWGYLIANIWLYLLGVLLVLVAGATASPLGIAGGVLVIAGGSLAGILFLLGLLVGETDEAFANIYSSAVSLQNVFERVPQKAFVIAIAAIGTALAAGFDMLAYESFLFLIGSVFVPLFGVFVVSQLVRRWGRVVPPAVAFVAWIAGFLLYHWINPSPLEWWLETVTSAVGDPLSVTFPWLSASPAAFLLAAALALVASRPVSSPHRKEGDR
jgi:putative hydroxymethylpyrimidine transporter CytX